MTDADIPDIFYIYESDKYDYRYLCHKSCVIVSNSFSNNKFYYLQYGPVSNEIIAILRSMCDIIDEIEEKTYFVNRKFNNLWYDIHANVVIHLSAYGVKIFNNVNDFIEYLNKNYPESIKNNDIKIALKD
jgi:hypothetical protein